jgi:hypothetical protein
MTVVLTGYLKNHPATKQESQSKKVEQSAGVLGMKLICNERDMNHLQFLLKYILLYYITTVDNWNKTV